LKTKFQIHRARVALVIAVASRATARARRDANDAIEHRTVDRFHRAEAREEVAGT
jgi:hypothetical protein